MKINNHLNDDHKVPAFVVAAGDVKVNSEALPEKFLNGFEGEININEFLPEDLKDKIYGESKITLVYNFPEDKLYVSNRFIVKNPLEEEEIKRLGEFAVEQWLGDPGKDFASKPVLKLESEKISVDPTQEKEEVYCSQVPIHLPDNFYWLGAIFDTPERQMMYEEFLEDEIIYNRLVKMCEKKKLSIPEEVKENKSSSMLPIHTKEPNTNEILIHEGVLKVFDQYQYAQNFLNKKEFPIGTVEHDLGKLMMLSPKFCDFMIGIAEDKAANKEIYNFEANYEKAVADAIKYISKNKSLLELYENYWEKVVA